MAASFPEESLEAELERVKNADLDDEEKAELLAKFPGHCPMFEQDLTKAGMGTETSEPQEMQSEECFRACPKIIPRHAWKAKLPKRPNVQMLYRARPAIFKTTDGMNCKTKSECIDVVNKLQYYQMAYLQFNDIAYSFMIGEDGNIYEGRGWGVTNEKAEGFVGIGFIGYYSTKPNEEPTDAMLQAAYDLIMCGVRKGFVNNPFLSNAYSGDTPIEMMREFIKTEEDIDYKTRPEDTGAYEEDLVDEDCKGSDD